MTPEQRIEVARVLKQEANSTDELFMENLEATLQDGFRQTAVDMDDGIIPLPQKFRDELWDRKVIIGYIEEESYRDYRKHKGSIFK